jgi:antagonist of KipI
MSLSIVKTGIHCSVQDQGRWGHQRFGVPVSGCMDKHAASVANILCGNAHELAVMEFLMHGARIKFETDHLVAFSGGGAAPVVANNELPLHRAIFVPANTVVDLRYIDKGCRLYMAVAGGINTTIVMGSRSAYEAAGAGSRIWPGESLPVGIRTEVAERMIRQMAPHGVTVAKWGAVELLEEMGTDCIRVLRGPEWGQFSESARKKWLSAYYQVAQASDRMGYTLSGEPLHLAERKEMISTAVTAGTVQVVPDGSPLVLMADAQTTGGYPRIAQVIEADIALFAQKRPGDKIRFREVSEAVADQLFVNRVEERKRIEKTIAVKFCI